MNLHYLRDTPPWKMSRHMKPIQMEALVQFAAWWVFCGNLETYRYFRTLDLFSWLSRDKDMLVWIQENTGTTQNVGDVQRCPLIMLKVPSDIQKRWCISLWITLVVTNTKYMWPTNNGCCCTDLMPRSCTKVLITWADETTWSWSHTLHLKTPITFLRSCACCYKLLDVAPAHDKQDISPNLESSRLYSRYHYRCYACVKNAYLKP